MAIVPAAGRAETNSHRLWWPVGEQLTYNIYWGVIPVGYSHVTTGWLETNGEQRIFIRFRTRSNKVLAKLYPVDDRLEAIINPDTFLPDRFTKLLREGGYRCDEVTTFDYEKLMATWTSNLTKKKKEFPIDPDTRDIVTFLYYLRSKQFEPWSTNKYRVMADERLYDLWVESEEVESLRLGDYGQVPSLRFKPEAAFGGVFVRKGKMWIWVSRDERHLCTKIAARVPVASITLLLAEVGGPGEDFWIQATRKHERKESERGP